MRHLCGADFSEAETQEETANYARLFERNLIQLTEKEREMLILIPGMGGVGCSILESLVRGGFERFRIVDPQKFEEANTARQTGCNQDTIGKEKVLVMKDKMQRINPWCEIDAHVDCLNKSNVDSLMDKVNLVIDGIEFFEPTARRVEYCASYEKRKPCLTFAPAGFSYAQLNILETGWHPDMHFNWKDSDSGNIRIAKFLAALTPELPQRAYMQNTFSLRRRIVKATPSGMNFAAAAAYHASVKIARGNMNELKPLPYYRQFDVEANKYIEGRLEKGNKSLMQMAKIAMILMT